MTQPAKPAIDSEGGSPGHSAPWTARVVTLFPETFPGTLGCSLIGKALNDGLWQLELIDLRHFGSGKHRQVDDKPLGGGPGMILRADVVAAAAHAAAPESGYNARDWPLVCLTARGQRFNQEKARAWSACRGVTIIAGRFEGIDQRVVNHLAMEEVSLGDFILAGGEIAAKALIESVVRLIPSVLGNQKSIDRESFTAGLLEYPQYTRPVEWAGRAVPEILVSGHHRRIAAWRQQQSEETTRQNRPDLWAAYCRSQNIIDASDDHPES
ncbi:MAG: tRNA (guanosine(37)-N1)-methyltransferase TrmD [Rhodobacteraceae bacterium]|nr:tRNA (guanosine(37)-N1)-methyltransferase TrmD [Paracoccaceae bacterium]